MWKSLIGLQTSLVEEEEGDKSTVSTKEQADHSLPYVLAVAILDGQVMPEQYARAYSAGRRTNTA